MSPPPPQPLVVDGLKTVAGIADIVIAGHRAEPHPQTRVSSGCIAQIRLDLGTVHGDVAGMVGEVRRCSAIRRASGGQLSAKCAARAQMCPRSGLSARARGDGGGVRHSCEDPHPAAIRRSAWPSGQWLPPKEADNRHCARPSPPRRRALSSTDAPSGGPAAPPRTGSGAGFPLRPEWR